MNYYQFTGTGTGIKQVNRYDAVHDKEDAGKQLADGGEDWQTAVCHECLREITVRICNIEADQPTFVLHAHNSAPGIRCKGGGKAQPYKF